MRFIAFIVSILLLSQSINFHLSDIVKIGDLIEHAQFHQDEYGDDWLTFLSKHYGELKDQHEEQNPFEHNQHDKLPFQHDNHKHANVQLFASQKAKIVIKRPSFFEYKEVNSYEHSFYNSPSLSTILQPPQTV